MCTSASTGGPGPPNPERQSFVASVPFVPQWGLQDRHGTGLTLAEPVRC
jgi:hypothetical protein